VPDPNPAQQLLDVLDLNAVPEAGPDVFDGDSMPNPWGRVFGGQVLAQSLLAAMRSLPEDGRHALHSMHGYFLRPGDPHQPIRYSVERLRDGRSFSARRIQALQGPPEAQVPIFSCIASFQLPAAGVDHQVPMPDVPGPETVPSLTAQYAGSDDPDAQWWVRRRPVEVRHLAEPIDLEAAEPRTATQAVWLKVFGDLPDDPGLHAALLAYASDFTILEPVLRRHGVAWRRPGLRVASLDHAMWWHRPVRADQWLLYVEESPSASGARGLSLGRMYTQDGQLVCSVAQEGMVRVPAGRDDPGADAPGLAARAGGE
jgi:acyl-CoA thioesterase-2